MNSFAELFKESVGELVCNVKAPAVDALAHIMLGNAVFTCKKFTTRVDMSIESRQDSDAPPSRVIGRALLFGCVEIIPFVIGRAFIARGATVSAVFVEISAVASRVVENTIEDDLHSSCVRGFDECLESLLAAEFIRDLQVIRGVVFMIADGIEDRREIKYIHAEGFEIIKLFDNSPKIAAEEVVVLDLRSAVFGILRNAVFPIGIKDCVVTITYISLSLCKTVEKNMIHYPTAEPRGHAIFGAIDGQAKFVPILRYKFKIDVILRARDKLFPASAENICIVKKPRLRSTAKRGCIEAQLIFIVYVIGRDKPETESLHRIVFSFIARGKNVSANAELGACDTEASRYTRRYFDNAPPRESAECGNVLAPAPFFDAGSGSICGLHKFCKHILLLDHGIDMPDILCVISYRAVCGEEAALCYIDE